MLNKLLMRRCARAHRTTSRQQSVRNASVRTSRKGQLTTIISCRKYCNESLKVVEKQNKKFREIEVLLVFSIYEKQKQS